jgi:dTMP kinase
VEPGLLITVEGGEGSGKTTQCALLAEWLQAQGLLVTRTREPGGTPAADRLREILLDPQLERLDGVAEVLLFAASRAQVVEHVIRPALRAGRVVLCDRFVDSSIAYQGYGLGVDLGLIRYINEQVTRGLVPVLTLLLDLPPEEGRARRGGRPKSDRIEARGQAYHETVRAGYLALAAADPERIRVVDARGDVASVRERVLSEVREVLVRRRLVRQ